MKMKMKKSSTRHSIQVKWRFRGGSPRSRLYLKQSQFCKNTVNKIGSRSELVLDHTLCILKWIIVNKNLIWMIKKLFFLPNQTQSIRRKWWIEYRRSRQETFEEGGSWYRRLFHSGYWSNWCLLMDWKGVHHQREKGCYE